MTEINIRDAGDILPPIRIYPDTRDVLITKAYLGVGFRTEDQEDLSVCMRDSGYELRYAGQTIQLFNGQITVHTDKTVRVMP